MAPLYFIFSIGNLMDIRVSPCNRLEGTITAQPSKNYTTRYLLASALAEGESLVRRPAKSDDAAALISCLRALGAEIVEQGDGCRVRGFGRRPRNPGVINPHNAGAVLRFLLGTGALLPEVRFITDFPESLGKRPNADILDALAQLGVKSESDNGRLPITLYGGNLRGGKITVSGEKSSQFLSSLLFLAPLIGERVEIAVVGNLKSKAAVWQTLDVIREAGIDIKADDALASFVIEGGQRYQPRVYEVNGDWPGSAAVLAAAAVSPESDVAINGLCGDRQGERAIVDVLAAMGADIAFENRSARVRGGGMLRSVEFDGDKATDAVLAMVGAACLAQGTSRFFNVENLRLKECDRIAEPLGELAKLGVRASEKRDEIIIEGNPAGFAGGMALNGRGDHRVIMLLTIVGIRTQKGIIIEGAEHIAKSYPDFFRHMESLGAKFEYI